LENRNGEKYKVKAEKLKQGISDKYASVTDQKTGKTEKTEIQRVVKTGRMSTTIEGA